VYQSCLLVSFKVGFHIVFLDADEDETRDLVLGLVLVLALALTLALFLFVVEFVMVAMEFREGRTKTALVFLDKSRARLRRR
jgi:hypothetical protein